MHLTISGKLWEIDFVGQNDECLLNDGAMCDGITNYRDRTIYINKELITPIKLETTIHELIHAYIDSCGMRHKEYFDQEDIAYLFGACGADCVDLARDVVKKHLVESDNA